MRRPMTRLAVLAALAPTVAMAGAVGTSSGQDATRSAAGFETQRCFGAASRDPERRCVNKRLRRVMVPTPEEARTGQNSPCRPANRTAELYPCYFGLAPEEARTTVALVGDSHAGHWRAAIDVVAHERRWHGVSLTQTGCPMTRATPILQGSRRDDCLAYNEAIGPWLRRHPEVTTVFMSQHGGKVVAEPGQSQRAAQIDGFRRAFSELPESVEHVVIIRGTPWSTSTAPACLAAAVRRRVRTDRACALPRKRALRPDLAAVAARRLRSERVKVVDLTRFMCGPKRCFPVVGGALVHKDNGHITQVFSRTLGPFLARHLDRAIPPRG